MYMEPTQYKRTFHLISPKNCDSILCLILVTRYNVCCKCNESMVLQTLSFNFKQTNKILENDEVNVIIVEREQENPFETRMNG